MCHEHIGDYFEVTSGTITMPAGQGFPLYAMAALLPLLPAKQRRNHPADWMETDARVTCPDPACRLIMRIDRTGQRVLKHDDVSPIAWESGAR